MILILGPVQTVLSYLCPGSPSMRVSATRSSLGVGIVKEESDGSGWPVTQRLPMTGCVWSDRSDLNWPYYIMKYVVGILPPVNTAISCLSWNACLFVAIWLWFEVLTSLASFLYSSASASHFLFLIALPRFLIFDIYYFLFPLSIYISSKFPCCGVWFRELSFLFGCAYPIYLPACLPMYLHTCVRGRKIMDGIVP